MLYVLEGTAVLTVGGETHPLAPGTGVFVARGTPWSVGGADGLLLLSVLVEEPLAATSSHASFGESCVVKTCPTDWPVCTS